MHFFFHKLLGSFIGKIQVRPGRPAVTEDEIGKNYLTRLPVMESKKAAYVPMPYTFRVKSMSNRVKVNTLLGRAPPFYLLLDHTIAVIWAIFGNQEYDCPLGIAQLQWALSFLKTVHTPKGDRPEDVQLCIDAIENILVDKYAELSTEINGLEDLDKTVHYVDGALGSKTMITQALPFSLNYAEMMTRTPSKGVEKTESVTSAEAQLRLDDIKMAAGVESIENL
ncbi:hypothetical protein NQ317_014222, partial [Molorchus minor]